MKSISLACLAVVAICLTMLPAQSEANLLECLKEMFKDTVLCVRTCVKRFDCTKKKDAVKEGSKKVEENPAKDVEEEEEETNEVATRALLDLVSSQLDKRGAKDILTALKKALKAIKKKIWDKIRPCMCIKCLMCVGKCVWKMLGKTGDCSLVAIINGISNVITGKDLIADDDGDVSVLQIAFAKMIAKVSKAHLD